MSQDETKLGLEPVFPIQLSVDTPEVGEGASGLFRASSPDYPGGVALRYYGQHATDTNRDSFERVAHLTESGSTPVVSIIEGLPVIAQPGETADMVESRWRLLKLITNNATKIEPIDEFESLEPEQLRKEIEAEFHRLFDTYLGHGDRGRSSAIDWETQKLTLGFGLGGQELPYWMRTLMFRMHSDGTSVKYIVDRFRSRYPGYNSNGPIMVNKLGGGSALQPKGQPLEFKPVTGVETEEEHYARLAEAGYVYKDLELHRFPELLTVLRRAKPPTWAY